MCFGVFTLKATNVEAGPVWKYFLDRRTEVHKAKKDVRGTASVPKMSLLLLMAGRMAQHATMWSIKL